ncbi:MAG: hypothetical protein H0T42_00050 [Deltaproteobacteria bacterium]|nr:hypothetical protein [Deltaproteobacteria bacterium]
MTTESSRGFYVLASVCAGAALGLAAYRFGVLPFAWKATGSFLFPGITVGLALAARSLTRHREGRPAIALLVLGALFGAGAAFGAAYLAVPPLSRARMTTYVLPGFSIGLPPGDLPGQRIFDYELGKLMMQDVGGQGGVVVVSWEGGEPSHEDLELAAKALGPAMGMSGSPTLVTMTGPRGTAVETVLLEGDKSPMRMSYLPCGARRVLLATMAGDNTAAVHGRILPTFVCKPDPKLENLSKGIVPLVAELPGWFATDRDPGQVVLSDGSGMVLLKTMPHSPKGIEDMVVPMFNAVGWKLAITGHVGDRSLVSGTIEDQLVHGWVKSVQCSTQMVMVVAIAAELAGADKLAKDLESARCVRHQEAPTVWPDPPVAPAAP